MRLILYATLALALAGCLQQASGTSPEPSATGDAAAGPAPTLADGLSVTLPPGVRSALFWANVTDEAWAPGPGALPGMEGRELRVSIEVSGTEPQDWSVVQFYWPRASGDASFRAYGTRLVGEAANEIFFGTDPRSYPMMVAVATEAAGGPVTFEISVASLDDAAASPVVPLTTGGAPWIAYYLDWFGEDEQRNVVVEDKRSEFLPPIGGREGSIRMSSEAALPTASVFTVMGNTQPETSGSIRNEWSMTVDADGERLAQCGESVVTGSSRIDAWGTATATLAVAFERFQLGGDTNDHLFVTSIPLDPVAHGVTIGQQVFRSHHPVFNAGDLPDAGCESG